MFRLSRIMVELTASSRTKKRTATRLSLPVEMKSAMRPGVPTTMSTYNIHTNVIRISQMTQRHANRSTSCVKTACVHVHHYMCGEETKVGTHTNLIIYYNHVKHPCTHIIHNDAIIYDLNTSIFISWMKHYLGALYRHCPYPFHEGFYLFLGSSPAHQQHVTTAKQQLHFNSHNTYDRQFQDQ